MTSSLSLVLSRGLLAALACGLTAGAAQAMTMTGFSPTFDCPQVSYSAFTLELDRNNMGAPAPGMETYTLDIRDGAGVALFSFTNPGWEINGPIPQSASAIPYGTPPTANPITITVVSPAGNGLPQQTVFTASGSCSTLPPAVVTPVPTADVWALGGLACALALFGAARVRRQRLG